MKQKLIDNRYKIEEIIGRGGMGVVYKVLDTKDNTIKALKTLTTFSIDRVRRFYREFRAIYKLRHPFIVTVYDNGLHGNIPYFTMEYIEGISLRDLFGIRKENKPDIILSNEEPFLKPKDFFDDKTVLKKDKKIFTFNNKDSSIKDIHKKNIIDRVFNDASSLTKRVGGLSIEVIDLFIKICQALDYIHANRIIHRDIKPENIIVTEDKQNNTLSIKLLDFGIAKLSTQDIQPGDIGLTQHGTVLGSVYYISPEQARGFKVDGRSDLYSFGVILYEIVTGMPIFKADNQMTILIKHVQEEPVPPSHYDTTLHPYLESIIMKLLSKEPQMRYPSARALKAEFETLKSLLITEKDNSKELDRGLVTVKATRLKEEIIPTKELDSSSLRICQIFNPAYIGRDGILKELLKIVEQKEEESGKIIFISGSAGIGKSRLLKEFESQCKIKNIEVLTGRCSENRAISLPFTQILKEYLNRWRYNPEKLVSNIGPHAKNLQKIYPELEEYSFMNNFEENLIEVEPEKARRDLMGSFSSFLNNISKENKVVLFLEDFHWAEPDHIDMLEYIEENLSKNLIICLTYRDDELYSHRFTEHPLKKFLSTSSNKRIFIHLDGLSKEDIIKIVTSMLGSENIPEYYFNHIYNETNGNPLFVQEMVRNSVEKGELYNEKGVWKWSGVITDEIPKGISEVISKRLERLTEDDQEVLSIASTFGDEFIYDILLKVSKKEENELLDILNELIHLQLIEEVEFSSEDKYRFCHVNIRSVVYHKIQPLRKKIYHKRIAQAMEEYYSNKGMVELFSGELAIHYERGGDNKKAVDYYIIASNLAQNSYQFSNVITYLKKVLELIEKDDKKEGEILEKLGDVYFHLGKWDEAFTCYDKGVSIVDDNLKIDMLRKLAEITSKKGDYNRSLNYISQAKKIISSLTNISNKSIALLESVEGEINYNRGNLKEASACFKRGLNALKNIGNCKELGIIYRNIGHIYYQKGEYDKALEYYNKSLNVRKEILDEKGVGESYFNIGYVYWKIGNFNESLKFHQEGLKVREKIGDVAGIGESLLGMGNIKFHLGNFTEAMNYYENSLKVFEKLGDTKKISQLYNNIGCTCDAIGDRNKSLKYFIKSLRIEKESGDYIGIARLYQNIGEIYLAQNDLKKAKYYLTNSEKLVKTYGFEKSLPGIYIALGELYINLMDVNTAFLFSKKAVSLSISTGRKMDEGMAQRILGSVYLLSNDIENAEKCLKTSAKILQELGNQIELAKSYFELGKLKQKKGDFLLSRKYLQRALKIFTQEKVSDYIEKVNKFIKEMEIIKVS